MAYLLTKYVKKLDGLFDKVIFAIPSKQYKNDNYIAFEMALNNPEQLVNVPSVKKLINYLDRMVIKGEQNE